MPVSLAVMAFALKLTPILIMHALCSCAWFDVGPHSYYDDTDFQYCGYVAQHVVRTPFKED